VSSADHYAALHANFRWQVDSHFNIAEVCCGRWARAEAGSPVAIKKIAVCAHSERAESTFYTYSELQAAADALSHRLARLGVQRGDRVAIVMPQRFETAAAYIAVLQFGAVAMPLSMLFGPEALGYRLQDSGAVGDCGQLAWGAGHTKRCGCRAGQPLRAGRHAGGRRRDPDLHQRHHRPTERRAAAAPGVDRQFAGVRLQPELVRL